MTKIKQVSIFGAGYVGMALSLCFSIKNVKSVIVETNKDKLNLIKKGLSPIKEGDFDKLTTKYVKKGLIIPTSNSEKAVLETDISFICVGTPSNDDGSVNTKYIISVAKDIAQTLKKKKDYHLIVIRSTVPPGTVEELNELVEEISGKTAGAGFGICSNPEFLREGTSIEDFFEGEFTIIGSEGKKEALLLEAFYRQLGLQNIYLLESKASELFKYLNNSFHALKVGFANEVGRLSNVFGVDSKRIMEIFVKDKRLNISPYYMRPGFAFGGSCLPKDVRALQSFSKEHKLSLPIIENIMKSNERHIVQAADLIRELDFKNVGFAGLVFKEGTDDFRESPYLELISELSGRSINKFVYDSNLQSKDLIGVNKAFIQGFFAASKVTKTNSLTELFEKSEVVIVGQLLKEEFKEIVQLTKGNNKLIIDLNNSLKQEVITNYRSFV